MKWTNVKFAELFRVKHGYAFKGDFFDKSGEYVLLTPGSFHEEGGYREQGEKTKFFTGDISDDYLLNEGELLVAMTEQGPGLLGSSAWIPKSNRFLHNQRLGRIVDLDKRRLDQRFLYYLFNTRGVRAQIAGSASGTKVRHTAPERIGRVEVELPPVEVQRTIAAILTAYDELMENNRRRMELLAQSARLLYREWFVRLRFPGHEHARLTNGVPEGWEQVQLRNIINVTHGYAFQGSHFSDESTSRVLATPGNFRIGGGIKYDKLKFYSEEGPLETGYVFDPMDLMLTMTDLSKTCDTLGFPAFVPKLDEKCFLHNQRIGRVVPLGTFFPKYFLYCLFCDGRYRHHIVGAATGTSVKHTSPKRILSYTALVPKAGMLIDAFENFVGPIFQQINILIEANQKLRAARDLLLPRLMSGEIEV